MDALLLPNRFCMGKPLGAACSSHAEVPGKFLRLRSGTLTRISRPTEAHRLIQQLRCNVEGSRDAPRRRSLPGCSLSQPLDRICPRTTREAASHQCFRGTGMLLKTSISPMYSCGRQNRSCPRSRTASLLRIAFKHALAAPFTHSRQQLYGF